MSELLFPHESIRNVQNEMLTLVQKCIETRKPLLVHAPTGLGKTVATLAPAVTYAKDKDLVVFFLTSRHTQHLIAIQTLKDIKQKFNVNPGTVSIVGKKHLCAQSGVSTMRSDDFIEYCRALREDEKCSYYLNTRTTNGLVQPKAELVAAELRNELPAPSEHLLNRGIAEQLCPYELAVSVAKEAKVIIADYNYLFNSHIREAFLSKIGKKLAQCIVIIDEGHNLPSRLREQQTQRLSSLTVRRAIKEAKKYNYSDVLDTLVGIQEILNKLSLGLSRDQERLVTKQQLVDEIKRVRDYEEIVTLFELTSDGIREEQKTSAIGGIAAFLKSWNEGELGYSRIISVKQFGNESVTVLSRNCMDPSIVAKEVIDNAHNVIMMSGTLTPTSMFADLLGFPNTTIHKEFPSPFPVANKISLIVPSVTTKFTSRSEVQFKNIASICANIVNNVPGCSAIFFPSYVLRDEVAKFLQNSVWKTLFFEDARATKEDRQELLKRFTCYKDSGAVLLGVAAGSFGEGIDLPGILKSVIVVGIPLDRPDLETKELINYYDKKFKRGWDYGYVLPAVTKTLQNAGRCIRSENDKGVLVFMDERYAKPMYARCFPKDWNPKLTNDPTTYVKQFFNTQNFI